ncbi:hypothetical protein Q9306_06880 [Bacillus sp. WLY-B-L8]|nr:hypothetical protein [Bacillus sp. WLY-B-L8]
MKRSTFVFLYDAYELGRQLQSFLLPQISNVFRFGGYDYYPYR